LILLHWQPCWSCHFKLVYSGATVAARKVLHSVPLHSFLPCCMVSPI
jgi:hypothetical protein